RDRNVTGVQTCALPISAFVMILNETIVSIALPQLATTLEVSTSTIQWLISGFLLTMAVVIPMTGFLLNKFSPRTMFLAAVGSFTDRKSVVQGRRRDVRP